ncbi:MAG TPA: hypothetical protein VIL49_17920 [Capillimicrobium sp.]|jgi:hypothetical protein
MALRSAPVVAVALALAAPAGADARSAVVDVTVRGEQRYAGTAVTRAADDGGAHDERGTVESRTVATFRSTRPARATVSVSRRAVTLDWQGAAAHVARLPVRARFAHSGTDRSESTGFTVGDWQPVPPPAARNCAQTVGWLGFDLRVAGERLEALSDGRLWAPTASTPFRGCPWGDPSVRLYPAAGRLPVARLVRGARTEVVLRGRETDRWASERTTGEVVRTATVRVTFAPVR